MKRIREAEQGPMNKRSYGFQEGGQSLAQMAEFIKTGQRSSINFKNAWHTHCEANGQMMFDPTKQSTEFIQGFLDTLGKAYMAQSGGAAGARGGGYGQDNGSFGGGRGGYDQHSGSSPTYGNRVRANTNSRNQAQDPAFGKVIELVKQGQRNSPEWKNMWIDWCQENGNGVHDPTRHSPCFIIAFVLKYGLAEVVSAHWASPYLVSLGELAKPFMVQTIKKGQSMSEIWKDQWGTFADSKANGTRDPNRHDAGSLMEFFDTIALQQFSSEAWMSPYITGNEANLNV